MTRENLKHIAAIIAADGELFTDGECLGLVWSYLEQRCGIDPEQYRGKYVGEES